VAQQIIVAAVQMDACYGEKENNLKKAEEYIEQASAKGAQLILLPELLPHGYGLNETVWDFAESIDGPSVDWLKNKANTYNAYVGFTFLEADGKDFYNTFVLAAPNGKIAGRVRKSPAPAVESYFYREGNDSHIIETDIGKVGVCICYEMLLYDRINELYEADIDLCIQPSAAGRPKPFIPGDVARLENAIANARSTHYQALGVPIVMSNRIGKLEGKLPGVMGSIKSSFMGGSYISDSDGQILGDLMQDEGVITHPVVLDGKYKPTSPPKKYGKMWSTPMPWYGFIFPMTQKWGEKSYENSSKRRIKSELQFNKCNEEEHT